MIAEHEGPVRNYQQEALVVLLLMLEVRVRFNDLGVGPLMCELVRQGCFFFVLFCGVSARCLCARSLVQSVSETVKHLLFIPHVVHLSKLMILVLPVTCTFH